MFIKREDVYYSSLSCFLDELEKGIESNNMTAGVLDVSYKPLITPDREVLLTVSDQLSESLDDNENINYVDLLKALTEKKKEI